MRPVLTLLLLTAVPLSLACGDDEIAPTDPAVVATGSGQVKGTVSAKSRAFLGIPYAVPPVGDLRWTAPAPPKPWTTALDATKAGKVCPQIGPGLTPVKGEPSEDCLTINVWTPLPVPDKAPVMVWIHGGGNVSGSSTEPTYDGKALAEKRGVVLVSFNYRLGALGFLAHPSLSTGSGNFGIQDQQAALKWVNDNIAAFGGDPKNVTLFGQSAGSIDVCTHLTTPGSEGLFHRAIMQSGACSTSALTKTEAQAQGKKLSKALKCDSSSDELACLRKEGADKVNKALAMKEGLIIGEGASWGPSVDGVVVPEMPMKRLQSGNFNKVPVLAGFTKDEGTIFLLSAKMFVMTATEYDTLITKIFGATLGAKVKAEYPLSAYKEVTDAAADLIGDAGFICPLRRAMRAVKSAGQKAWFYRFTRVPSFMNIPFLGAYHGSDLAFVFNNANNDGFTTDEAKLSESMMGYWTRFARGDDPNGDGATAWPAYDKTSDKHLQLDLTIKSAAAHKQKKCDFWDGSGF